MRLKALAVLISAVVFAGSAQAANFYVATSGNDANAGTLAAPFRTINKGVSAIKAGDVLNVRGGVYNGTVSIASVGTASAPITIQSYPGETAVIDGTGTAVDTNLVTFNKAAFVTFSGFEVRNATRIGICLYPASNITLTNNNIHDSRRNAIYAGYSAWGSVHDIVIDGNEVHDNVTENVNNLLGGGGWANGIGIHVADRVQITNNRIHHNWGEGVSAGVANYVTIQNNVAYDNFSVNLYIDNGRFVTVDRNMVYNADTTRYRSGQPASGIGTANEAYSITNPLSDLTITNNIVVNSKWGFYYGAYENGGGLKNTTVANNTFYRATTALLWIQSDAHQNSVVENNIFYQVGAVMADVAGAGVSYRSNNWYGGNAGAAAGAGDILADPRLANAGGYTAADYKVSTLSPVLRAGISLSTVTTDYFGAFRGSSFDIGAHQASIGSGATADLSAPSVPVSVTATSANSSSIDVSWAPATDNVGVTGYKIYRNNAYLTSVTGTTYHDTAVAASVTYTYAVLAYDGAGNSSALSANVSAAPLPTGVLPGGGTSYDGEAPTSPASLRATATGTTTLSIAWNASTDNVGVSGYTISRNGVVVASVTGTSWSDSGLKSGATYSYSVTAFDAAGNRSNASLLSVTTAKLKARNATH